jgi:hypothetical protein
MESLQKDPHLRHQRCLTVDQRPGDGFSFIDAKLSLWNFGMYGGTTAGTALHLRCDPTALFSVDEIIASLPKDGSTRRPWSTRRRIDAASDFDELLTMVGRRSGLDVRRRTRILRNVETERHLGRIMTDHQHQ